MQGLDSSALSEWGFFLKGVGWALGLSMAGFGVLWKFLQSAKHHNGNGNGNGYSAVMMSDVGTLKQAVSTLTQMQGDGKAVLELIERHESMIAENGRKTNQILDAMTIKISGLEAASDRIENAVERMLGGRRRRTPNRRRS